MAVIAEAGEIYRLTLATVVGRDDVVESIVVITAVNVATVVSLYRRSA